MRVRYLVLASIVLTTIAAPTLVAAAGPVDHAAPAAPNGTATATPTPTATPTGPPEGVRTSEPNRVDPNATAVAQLDPAVRVLEYEATGDGGMRITFAAEVPRTITVTQAVSSDDGGAVTVAIERYNLASGKTVVTFPAETVVITSAESIARGQAVRLSTDGGATSPTQGLGSDQALLLGATEAVGWVVVAGIVQRRRERSAPVELTDAGGVPEKKTVRETAKAAVSRGIHLALAHKLPVAGTVLGAGLFVATTRPELPELPPWAGAVAMTTLVLAIPMYGAGIKIYKWWARRNWVLVSERDGLRDTDRTWRVPPAIWAKKSVEETPPNPITHGCDYEVRTFRWEPGIEELTVDGTWPGDAKTGDLVTEKSHFDAIHGYLADYFRAFKRLRSEWSEMYFDLEGEILRDAAEADERGRAMDPDRPEEVWQRWTDRLDVELEPDDDDLPELPTPTDEQQMIDEPMTNGEAPEPADGPGGEQT